MLAATPLLAQPQPRAGPAVVRDKGVDMDTAHQNARPRRQPGAGASCGASASNRLDERSKLRPAVNGYAWRKAMGLLTWGDIARDWRFRRVTPPGYLCPVPWLDCGLPPRRGGGRRG